jgi:hypothetical protein
MSCEKIWLIQKAALVDGKPNGTERLPPPAATFAAAAAAGKSRGP